MANRKGTSTEVLANVTITGTNVPPEAIKGLAELIERISYQFSIEGAGTPVFDAQIVRINGSASTYSYTFAGEYDNSTNTFTFDFLERVYNGDELTVDIPVEIPDPFTGTTQADALAARDAFFVANPSLLVNGLIVNIQYTDPALTNEQYGYNNNKWALISN